MAWREFVMLPPVVNERDGQEQSGGQYNRNTAKFNNQYSSVNNKNYKYTNNFNSSINNTNTNNMNNTNTNTNTNRNTNINRGNQNQTNNNNNSMNPQKIMTVNQVRNVGNITSSNVKEEYYKQ